MIQGEDSGDSLREVGIHPLDSVLEWLVKLDISSEKSQAKRRPACSSANYVRLQTRVNLKHVLISF